MFVMRVRLNAGVMGGIVVAENHSAGCILIVESIPKHLNRLSLYEKHLTKLQVRTIVEFQRATDCATLARPILNNEAFNFDVPARQNGVIEAMQVTVEH